jgi:hypothetical protein
MKCRNHAPGGVPSLIENGDLPTGTTVAALLYVLNKAG